MRILTALFVFFGVLSIGSLARAHTRVTYELKGDQLVAEGDGGFTTTVSVGCRGVSHFENEDRLYVACGLDGIAIFDITDRENPVLEKRAATEGEAVSFFALDGEVWVRMQNQVARPLSAAGVRAQPKPKPRPRQDTSFSPPPPPRRLGGLHESCREDADCSGPLHCIEEVCKNEEKPSGPDIVGPERRTGLSLGAEAFGYIPGSTAGFGVLLGAQASYRFAFPMALHLDLWPLGLTWADLGNILATSYAGIVTLDTQYFEMGLGPGVMTLNSRDGPQPAFLMSLYFRVGAADGLSFWFRPDVALVSHKMMRSDWDFGSFSGGIQIPLTPRWALTLRGGGGNSGWGRGELGVRFRAVGDGLHRSVFVSLGVGGAAMFLSANAVTYGGPSLGGGIEWRP